MGVYDVFIFIRGKFFEMVLMLIYYVLLSILCMYFNVIIIYFDIKNLK